MAKDDSEVISFQIQRSFSVLCKSFLNILESLQKEHQINVRKLHNSLGPNYADLIDMMDYFDAEKYSYIRKLVFDRGGEANREIQNEIVKYNLELIQDEKEKGK